MTAEAQFKVVGPPPFPDAVARQKIRTLLENVNASNRQQTLDTISGLLAWYRDILDEELIAAWQGNGRATLTEVIAPLASARVASSVVEFSWRQGRQATLNPTYAPLLEDLMFRYPDSAKPLLDDLLGAAPELTQAEAQAVCRILLDMPDTLTWRRDALQILPHYRGIAETLLNQDLHGGDEEKSYRAQLWLKSLNGGVPGASSQPQSGRARRAPLSPPAPADGSDPVQTPVAIASARAPQPTLRAPAPLAPPVYDGAKSGTLACTGGPIPQNAEYVFRNVPLLKMQLDYDTKIWDARLAPGEGQTQRLILKNKSSGPQKRCVVHWNALP